MAAQGELFSASDFTELKNLVKNEIKRRSNSNSVGSMKAYNGSSYNYTTIPEKGRIIKNEHIQKITKPLDAITGKNTTPSSESTVLSLTLSTATASVGNLSGISATSHNTGCKSSCSGLCSTGCYSGCTGCGNNCTGSCTGNCNGSCTGDCSGCSGSCSGCSGDCGDNCDRDCYPSCSYGCYGGCQGGSCGSNPIFI